MGDFVYVSMFRVIMILHDHSVVVFPSFTIPFCQLRRRASPLDSTVSRGVGGRKGKGELSSEGQPSTLTPLTENSGQTSGRLDETAERHETEGKRKWQSLSEGASTTLHPSKPLARKWYRGRTHHR